MPIRRTVRPAACGGARLFVETALPLLVVLGGTDVSGGYR